MINSGQLFHEDQVDENLNYASWQCNVQSLPECTPILSLSLCSGLCRILKDLTALSSARDIRATSRAWLSPFLIGSPDTTI